ncbi:MAG: hypothetical protein O3C28_11570 [Proteobacteria bacterium]|nr:hypothetical protein [Pseudomonadota bacterium]
MQANFSPIAVERSAQVTQTIRNWTVGQLFDVQVLARHSANSVDISVNGTTVRASSALYLQPGEVLKLEVTKHIRTYCCLRFVPKRPCRQIRCDSR